MNKRKGISMGIKAVLAFILAGFFLAVAGEVVIDMMKDAGSSAEQCTVLKNVIAEAINQEMC